jgi:hypothetical protein
MGAARRSDADGNTYQIRRLADGAEFEILENFPTREGLRHRLGPVADDIDGRELTYYWCATCTFRGA